MNFLLTCESREAFGLCDMRNVPNDIVSSLIRHLPVILESVDTSNNRMYNAVRLTKKIIKRLQKIEYEQGNNKQ